MNNKEIMPEVIFREKAPWQKDDCLFCEDNSTLEAVCGKDNINAQIRCCTKEACKEKAKKLALVSIGALSVEDIKKGGIN